MPYSDAQTNDIFSNPKELRPFESLPQPVAQRVASIDAAVSYITRLSAIYQEAPVKNQEIENEALGLREKSTDLNSARKNLEDVYGVA